MKMAKRQLLLRFIPLLCLMIPFLTWRLQGQWIQTSTQLLVMSHSQTQTRHVPVNVVDPASHTNSSSRTNKTLLIAQYTGSDTTYSALLNLTQPINEMYADTWGYDYMLFTGLMIQSALPEQNNTFTTTVPQSRATYNKVMILEKILTDLQYQQYDLLLILDSDAMLYDFSRDIASLIPNDRLLVAHKVIKNDTSGTHNINIGVTLWNLRHVAAKLICTAWKDACIHRILHSKLRDSDQSPLHSVLLKIPDDHREKLILAISYELGYRRSRFVRHFIRPDAENWTDYGSTMEYRIAGIQQTIHEICNRTYTISNYPEICADYFDLL